jgi:formylglycine-generating enzyme required for sulfatase activity
LNDPATAIDSSDAKALTVRNGVFTVRLGEGDTNNAPVGTDVFFKFDGTQRVRTDVKLKVWFSPQSNGPYTKLDPDITFASVPFAQVAGVAETVKNGAVTDSFPAGRSILSILPVDVELQNQGYARSPATLQVGGQDYFVYTRSSSPVFGVGVESPSGQTLVSGQSEPLDFGTITTPTGEIVLTVRNLGNRELTGLSASIDGTNPGDFTYSFGSTSVPVGGSTTLLVTFYRNFYGERNAAIHVTASGLGSPFDLQLRGIGGAPSGFALIPVGPFTMGRTSGDEGSNAPPVTVTVSAFVMQTTHVSWDQWNEVRNWAVNNGYTDLQTGAGKSGNHPVHSVNWWSAVKWCNARTEWENATLGANLTPVYRNGNGTVFKTGTTAPTPNWAANGYRLPTEAEWEKAARGGFSGRRFPWGDTINHSHANYYANSSAYSYDTSGYTTFTYHPTYNDGVSPRTSPVTSFAANGYGLHDMAGNVFDWCWDWYDAAYYANRTDPTGPATGVARVLRGGSWKNDAFIAHCSYRVSVPPGSPLNDGYGFRPARSRP